MNHIKEHLNKNTLLRLFKFNRHINLIARSILTMQSLTIRYVCFKGCMGLKITKTSKLQTSLPAENRIMSMI